MNVAQLQAELQSLMTLVNRFGAVPETMERIKELHILIADATKAEVTAEREALTSSLTEHARQNYIAAEALRVEAEQANQAQAMEEMRAQAEQAWIKAGGTAWEFTQEWPTLRAAMLRQKTLAAVGETQGSIVDKWLAARNRAAKPL